MGDGVDIVARDDSGPGGGRLHFTLLMEDRHESSLETKLGQKLS